MAAPRSERRLAPILAADIVGYSRIIEIDEADHLRGSFALLTGLQLKQQITDYRVGAPIGRFVDPRHLTERRLIRDSLRAINEFPYRVLADLTGSLL